MKKSTYFLLAIVLILLCFIFFFEKKQKSTSEIKESQAKLFAEFPSEIMAVERKGFEEFKIEKRGEGYYLIFPFSDSADVSSVKGFIDAVKDAKAERIINDKIGSEKLGLNNPQITVVFKSKEKEKTIKIGKSPPLEKGAYFESDDKIGVLSDFTIETIKRSVNDFRSKELCSPLKYESAQKMSYYKNGNKFLEFEKNEGKWFITYPFYDLADERKSSFFIEDVILWPIMNFENFSVRDETTKLKELNEKFEINSSDGKKVLINIGAVKDEEKNFYYASLTSRQGVFVVSKNSVRNIDKEPEFFRSLEVFPSEFKIYSSMTIERQGEKIVFNNSKENGWVEEKKKIKEEQIKTFLYSLDALEGEKRFEKADIQTVFANITLSRDGEKIERIFYEDKENLIVKISERNILVLLSKDDSERIKGAVRTIFAQFKESASH